MCEIFACSAKEPVQINELLEEFYSHSRRHPDGWGLYRRCDDTSCLHRECLPAFKSKKLERLLTKGSKTELLLAHIRYATEGAVCPMNVHPFQLTDQNGKLWTLVHNGMFCGGSCLPECCRVNSSTDSALLLGEIVNAINGTPDECIAALEQCINHCASDNKTNFFLSDGTNLFVYANVRERMVTASYEGAVLFSTLPLKTGALDWADVPMCHLQVYRGGKLVYSSKKLGQSFEPRPLPEPAVDF